MRPGQGLILITLTLLCLGVIMVTSAGLAVSGAPLELSEVLLGRTALLALLAVGAMAVGCLLPVERLAASRGRLGAMVLAAVVVVLLLAVHIPGIGREVNGAQRWVDLLGVGLQPSEVAKWAVVALLAWFVTARGSRLESGGLRLAPPLVFLGVVVVLIVGEDLGTAALIGLVGLGVLLAAGARLVHVLAVAPLALAGLAAAVWSNPYRFDRLRAFVDPWQDPQGIGYHVIHSMATVNGGGVAGRGLGNGLQKLGYLPEDTTDFIFAVVCEELGLPGAVATICLFAALVICGGVIARHAATAFGRLLAFGIILTIGLQALMNMTVVTGMAPTKGIALPLVSSGGSGWVLTSFAIGLLVSIGRNCPEPEGISPADRRLAIRWLRRSPLVTPCSPAPGTV